MPHHKSTIKRLRQAEKAREYNRSIRTKLRNAVKAVRSATGNDAATKLVAAYRDLDLAVKKGVMPKQRAARLKSRLAKRSNAA